MSKFYMSVNEMALEVIKNNPDFEPSTFMDVIERKVEEEFPEDIYSHIYEKYITTENPKYILNIIIKIKELLMNKR